MPRKPKADPKCIQCKNVVSGTLYAIQFSTREGWCSETCFNGWADAEEARIERQREIDRTQSVVAPLKAQ